MNILVLGAGTFGTAIAHQLARNNNNNVYLFSRNKSKVDEINTSHTNISCFPNKKIGLKLKATNNKKDIEKSDIVFIALPSSVIIENLLLIKNIFKKNVLFVNLSKGLLAGGITVVDNIKESLQTENVVTLKGPSFAVELLDNSDTLLTLGYTTNRQCEIINSVIKHTSLHIDTTKDIRGVEILSVLKNIYALILGVIDAQYDSANTRFMILTKSFSEIRVLLELLGGKQETLFLACGFGDLGLTSLNDLSRNRTLGLLIGKGFFNADYKSNAVVLEGLNSIRMFYEIAGNKNIKELPLFNKLYNFLIHKERKLEFKFDDLN
tara:strand:+ start:442 stop:1407 length:966 start_codon:yes stop_codon:yes gene_type:complete